MSQTNKKNKKPEIHPPSRPVKSPNMSDCMILIKEPLSMNMAIPITIPPQRHPKGGINRLNMLSGATHNAAMI